MTANFGSFKDPGSARRKFINTGMTTSTDCTKPIENSENRVSSPKVRYGINVYKSVRGSSNDSIRKIMGLLSDRQRESINAGRKLANITRKENPNKFGADLTPYSIDQQKKVTSSLAEVVERSPRDAVELDRPNSIIKEMQI
mmetsp:Transcript_42382/g.55868  ORF Transcript_42382/g.55868 Transcript_42382/m.55868 type:complete len:142 (-) Transcript_42382:1483-1908(-)